MYLNSYKRDDRGKKDYYHVTYEYLKENVKYRMIIEVIAWWKLSFFFFGGCLMNHLFHLFNIFKTIISFLELNLVHTIRQELFLCLLRGRIMKMQSAFFESRKSSLWLPTNPSSSISSLVCLTLCLCATEECFKGLI